MEIKDLQLETLLETALKAALEAGAAILDVYGSDDFNIEHKEDDSPLTRADRRAHDIIDTYLQVSGLPVLSEEGADIPFSERRSWEKYWLVDPLDGTREFIKRNGEFTVNIALMERPAGAEVHVPAAGVVYVPVKDILYIGYVGSAGRGAWKIEEAAAGDTIESPAETISGALARGIPLPVNGSNGSDGRRLTVIVSRSHNTPESQELLARLEAEYGEARRISSGSSIKFCLVAEGAADIYPRFHQTMEWDTAAGDAVCRAAGCRVTEKDAVTALSYNKENLLNPWFIVMGPRIDAAVLSGGYM
ncbi:MAG: 3'(2'),5'-bisphosphate nucleotidase CysQ [Sediminispirochaetaceae bacterium]